MALEFDPFAVFKSIGSHRAAFDSIAGDLSKSAQTLVVKAIKDRKTGLIALRDIRSALGVEAFNLIADGMSDAQIKSLAARLDKHNPELGDLDSAARRLHVLALAEGAAQPREKAKAAPKRQAPKKRPVNKEPERIHFASAGATRKR